MESKTLAELVTKLSYAYPVDYLPKGAEWTSMMAVWTEALSRFERVVVARGLELVPGRHPHKFPTLPEVILVVTDEQKAWEREQGELAIGRMLPPARDINRGRALADFEKAVDNALQQPLGEEFNPGNAAVVEGLICCLFPVFGMQPSVARDDGHGLNFAKALVACWGKDGDHGLGRGFAPWSVVKALREVPGLFAKFPTEGMLASVIRGEFYREGWPKEYVAEERVPF